MTHDDHTALRLAALASAAVPGLDPKGAATIAAPGAARLAVLVVDSRERRWLVEQAATAADSAAEDRATPLLALLAARLPVEVPRPEGAVVVKGARVTVTAWADDHPLDPASLTAGPGLSASVGRVLAAVHDLDPAMFDEAGMPSYDAESYRRRRLSDLDRAASTGHVPVRLLARWEQALELVPLWRFAPTPTHGDLTADALRCDGEGRLRAITRWHHAQVADPADDLAHLYEAAHPDAFDTILEAYSAARAERPDAGLETRARLAGELAPVADLLRAHAAGHEQRVRAIAEQLEALDAETAGHPLVRSTSATPHRVVPPGAEHDESDAEPMSSGADAAGEEVDETVDAPVDERTTPLEESFGPINAPWRRSHPEDAEDTTELPTAREHPARPAGSRRAGTLPDGAIDTVEIVERH